MAKNISRSSWVASNMWSGENEWPAIGLLNMRNAISMRSSNTLCSIQAWIGRCPCFRGFVKVCVRFRSRPALGTSEKICSIGTSNSGAWGLTSSSIAGNLIRSKLLQLFTVLEIWPRFSTIAMSKDAMILANTRVFSEKH